MTSRPTSPPPYSTAVRLGPNCCQLTVSPTLMVLRTLHLPVPIETTKVVAISSIMGRTNSKSVLANNGRIEVPKFVHFVSCKHWLFQLLVTPLDRAGSGWLVVV